MNTTTTTAVRSQAWFHGFYVAVRQFRGIEVLDARRRGVQISKHTIHGTAAELRDLATQMLRAADLAEATAARS
jgi:hypothetical protein